MNEIVGRDEIVTRFLIQSNHIKRSINRPSYNAFMPDTKGELSVFRTSDLTHVEIEAIGASQIEPTRGPLKGYAMQDAATIYGAGLTIEAAPTSHPRHANIKGWKSDAENRIAAQKIAASAKLILYRGETSN